jgi:hypothetical protein
MSQDYAELYLRIKAKLKQYHDLTLKGKFDEATDVAIELSDLSIQLEAITVSHV